MQKFTHNTLSEQIIASVSPEEIDRRNEYAVQLNSQSQPEEAFSVADNSVHSAEEIGYTNGIARGLLVQCSSLVMLADYHAAEECCNRALKLFQESDDADGVALVDYYLGNCHFALGDFDEAQKLYESAFSRAIQLDDKSLQDRALNGIGNTLHERGYFEEALTYFQKSIAIKEELNDRFGVAGCGINMGNVYAAIGDYTKAYEFYNQSLQLLEESGDKIACGDCSNNIGLLFYRQGNYSEALRCFFKGIKLWHEVNDRRREAVSLHNIANIYSETGEHNKTLEYYELALAIEVEIGDKHGEADTLEAIGSTYFEQKEYAVALDFTKRSLEISRQIGNKEGEAIALTNLGSILAATGDYESALSAIQNGLELYRLIHDKSGEAECLQDMAKFYILMGDFIAALQLLDTALQLAEELESKSILCQIHQQFSAAYSLAENYRKALEHTQYAASLEKQIFSKENSQKINQLQANHELETARHESEIHRLKTIELAEANRQLQDLNRQKSDFLTIASHDLKNPLSNVLMLSKLLGKEAEHLTAAEVADFASDIQVITERMFKLVKKFLDINALESGKISPTFSETNITVMIQELIHAFKPIAKNKAIQVVFDAEADTVIEVTDETMLAEVIDNLLSNAVKYSPREKTVEIQLRLTPKGFYIAVQDEGPGISESDKLRLFKSFARLSAIPTGGEDSNGLGLFITKKMVELLGGTIYCESTEGHGATFVVEIDTSR